MSGSREGNKESGNKFFTLLDEMEKEIKTVIDKYSKDGNEPPKEDDHHKKWITTSLFHTDRHNYINTHSQEEFERMEIQDKIDEEEEKKLGSWFS